jgi:16S rRNA (adenine1518-N6/adenine1519-N6)-dimethyltransferase
MTLGEMRSLLADEGIRLTRSLGQSFLHDANQLRRILALAALPPNAEVLEIGPGLGPLTEKLLATGARIRAVEKDRRLASLLQRRFSGADRLQLITADALEWLRLEAPDASNWHVVSNLPYSVGSAILVELANLPRPPMTLTVTLQAEVVERIRARHGTAAFGTLTLLLARAYRPVASFRIPATCFFPVPDVISGCVRLERRHRPLAGAEDLPAYRQIVRLAFAQRRKRLQKTLRGSWPEERLAKAWAQLGLHADVRAEAVPPEDFARLAGLLGHPSAVGR